MFRGVQTILPLIKGKTRLHCERYPEVMSRPPCVKQTNEYDASNMNIKNQTKM